MGYLFMEATPVITALTGLIGDATETMTTAAPLVLTAMATIAGIEIGFRLFRKLKQNVGK